MAIIDTSITGSFNEDRDENVFIGLDLPIRKSDGVEGYFTATSTTIAAIKNNIRNLLLTNRGERYLQPNIGLNLRRYLFEQYSTDLEDSIKVEINDTIAMWLPFVLIKEITVKMSNVNDDIGTHTLQIYVVFSIQQAANLLENITVEITGD